MMARAMGLLAGLIVVMALTLAACSGDPPDPVPAQPSTPTVVPPPPQSDGPATMAAQSPPTAAVGPVPTATVAAPLPPATNSTEQPVSTSTPVSHPTEIDRSATIPERFLIRLKNDLDDPLGYCIDVRGFGSGIRLDADLQAHSCKSNSPDYQSFAMLDAPMAGGIVLVDYDVCLAVVEPEPGASILLRPCDDESVFRRFEWLDDGQLHLIVEQDASRPHWCIGVADGAGEPAGGRNHLRRDLMLRDCAASDLALIAWNDHPNQ